MKPRCRVVPSELADQAVMELQAVDKVPHRLHGEQPVEPHPLAGAFGPDARKSGPALARCHAGGGFLGFCAYLIADATNHGQQNGGQEVVNFQAIGVGSMIQSHALGIKLQHGIKVKWINAGH